MLEKEVNFKSVLTRNELKAIYLNTISRIPGDPLSKISTDTNISRRNKVKKVNEYLKCLIEGYNEDPDTYFLRETYFVSKYRNGLSVFPAEWACFIVDYFSSEGDKILNPFVARGSVVVPAAVMRREVYGVDVNSLFIKIAKDRIRKIKGKEGFVLGDSRNIPFRSNSFDLVAGSPPYFDREFYGFVQGNIGLSNTYQEFLEELGKIIQECFRVLKSKKYFVININDFRVQGKLVPYHADIIYLGTKAGFTLHDIIIVEVGNFTQAFKKRNRENRITAKTHEYLIVFKKQ